MIAAPATLVALLYMGLGFRPPVHAIAGAVIFLAAFAWVRRRKGANTDR